MAKRGDAYFLKIIGCQTGQKLGINVILAECRLVLPKAQTLQPPPDIHRRCLRLGDAYGRLSCELAATVQARDWPKEEIGGLPFRSNSSAITNGPSSPDDRVSDIARQVCRL